MIADLRVFASSTWQLDQPGKLRFDSQLLERRTVGRAFKIAVLYVLIIRSEAGSSPLAAFFVLIFL
ncbi:hypothetical protein EHV15_14680 [Paenibacillus oralis]|uniref:Uncharacterized protein n=1 Tax=Paenibacillus oralis TaxID=2490856 RepID=A0A3P3U2E4_9BACL|nr:hypothetical protein [Paenibacillus oralis]RRJ64036.1 hypothetical protein EHV15_14680 [Paenibacillus oralis]